MKKTDEALANILNAIASKFGTTVSHLYAVMIKQAFIDAIENIIVVVILSSILITYSVFYYKKYKAYQPKTSIWDNFFEEHTGLTVIMLFTSVLCILGIILNASNAIDALFNPDYYVLKQILKLT